MEDIDVALPPAVAGVEALPSLLAGVIGDDTGTYQSHLATGKNLDRFVAPESAATELAITHYRVIARYPDTTLVAVNLETGKPVRVPQQMVADVQPNTSL